MGLTTAASMNSYFLNGAASWGCNVTVGDKILSVVMVVFVAVAGYAHYDAQRLCLASVKPATASTGLRFVSPLTGEYERIGGILFCYDSRRILHAYREAPNVKKL